MDELSPLFQDIEFRERRRGYDVDQVDAYIDRVSQAAALVQGRVAELHQRVEDAESRLAQPAAAASTHPDSEESVARMLVLAQRTADAAIAEAEAEAARRRAEADEHASRVLAEAETDRRRTVTEAQSEAAEAVAAERARIAAEIGRLEEYKAFLSEDIEILETHLAEARRALSASLSGLTDLLEQPEAFRITAMPATSGALAAERLEASADEAASPADLADPEPVPELPEPVAAEPALVAEPDAATFDAAEASDAAAFDVVVETDPAPSLTFDPAPLPSAEPEALADADERADSVDQPLDDGPGPDIDLTEDPADLDEPSPAEPPLLVTAADIGAASEGEWAGGIVADSGPITEPVPAVADQLLLAESEPAATAEDPLLEQLREAVSRDEPEEFADDALTDFFDAEQDDGGRSWFSRRR